MAWARVTILNVGIGIEADPVAYPALIGQGFASFLLGLLAASSLIPRNVELAEP